MLTYLNKKIKNARQRGFIFNQKSKLTLKIYSYLSRINVLFYLKLQIPIMHRHFFKILSQNREDVKTHINDLNDPFHFACRKWYLSKNPQC